MDTKRGNIKDSSADYKPGDYSPGDHSPAIQTRSLRKVFGDKVAVEDLTLTVERGEVFGFLGPNGAGKTTSVKMLLSLVKPSGGEGSLFGKPIGDTQVRTRIGFLPEHFRFHDWLNAVEFLTLHADLYHIPPDVRETRIAELLDLVGLTPHAEKRLREYSKGMLQRIGLAQALLNQPDLVILDEPTSGLDPVGRRLVRDIIHDLKQEGTTIFLNSHLLSEVEITCDRVAFIKHGKVIRISALKTLVEGELSVEVRARNLSPQVVSGLKRWSQNPRLDGEHLSMTLPGEADLPAVNRYLVENGVDVYALQPQHISLEDLFIQIVGTDGGL
jgi:ABC-2 type transport system ATP-binding protein